MLACTCNRAWTKRRKEREKSLITVQRFVCQIELLLHILAPASGLWLRIQTFQSVFFFNLLPPWDAEVASGCMNVIASCADIWRKICFRSPGAKIVSQTRVSTSGLPGDNGKWSGNASGIREMKSHEFKTKQWFNLFNFALFNLYLIQIFYVSTTIWQKNFSNVGSSVF